MSELLKEIDEALKPYECKYHTWPSNDTPHGCTDCYNTGYVFDNPEAHLLAKAYDHIHSLTAENEKLKRIVEVLEKSNEFYANPEEGEAWGSDMYSQCEIIHPDDVEELGQCFIGGKRAREAKEEVERIRGVK